MTGAVFLHRSVLHVPPSGDSDAVVAASSRGDCCEVSKLCERPGPSPAQRKPNWFHHKSVQFPASRALNEHDALWASLARNARFQAVAWTVGGWGIVGGLVAIIWRMA